MVGAISSNSSHSVEAQPSAASQTPKSSTSQSSSVPEDTVKLSSQAQGQSPSSVDKDHDGDSK